MLLRLSRVSQELTKEGSIAKLLPRALLRGTEMLGGLGRYAWKHPGQAAVAGGTLWGGAHLAQQMKKARLGLRHNIPASQLTKMRMP